MTDSTTRSSLEKAYQLIQQDQLDQALDILRPIVAQDNNNADAWWLMANAVSNPNEAYNALSNVLRLEPQHEQARDLMDGLLDEYPDLATEPAVSALDSATGVDDLFAQPAETTATSDWGDEFFPASTNTEAPPAEPERDMFAEMFGDSRVDIDELTSAPLEPADASGNTGYDLNEFFATPQTTATTTSFDDDPFVHQDPDFVTATAATVTAAATEAVQPDKPPKRVKVEKPAPAPKPVRIVAEEAPPDPYAAEKKFNRGRNMAGFIAVAFMAALLLAGVYLIGRPYLPQPTVVSATDQVIADTRAALTDKQFSNPVVTFENGILNVRMCSAASPTVRDRAADAIMVVSPLAAKLQGTAQATQIEFVNCNRNNQVVLRRSAPLSAITDYVNGTLKDVQRYLSFWR